MNVPFHHIMLQRCALNGQGLTKSAIFTVALRINVNVKYDKESGKCVLIIF